MEKIIGSEDNVKHGYHRVLVAHDGDYCCYTVVEGVGPDEKKKDEFRWVGIGRITQNIGPDYVKTWRGRLKVAWAGLRGNFWGYDIEMYTREDCDRLVQALQEVRDICFPK